MAIQKDIRQDDGVTTNYHRIMALKKTINRQNSIEVLSYVDKESREMENEGSTPYKRGITYELDYDEDMTISEAYAYLKTLDVFNGATDI